MRRWARRGGVAFVGFLVLAQLIRIDKETAEDVADRDMPPWYYALVHPEARLDAAARERIQAWTELGAPAR